MTELDTVIIPSGQDLAVGAMGVRSILLDKSGNGPMGYYDIITVIFDNNIPTTAYPAHHCKGWQYHQKNRDGTG